MKSNYHLLKVIKNIIVYILYVVVLIYLIKYVVNNQSIMENILKTSKPIIICTILSTIASVLATAGLDIFCARAFSVEMKTSEVIGLTFIACALNLFLPLQMGSVIKGVCYKKKFELTYSKYISMLSGTAILNLLIAAFQLLGCLVIAVAEQGIAGQYLLMLFIVIVIAIIGTVIIIKERSFIRRIVPFKKYTLPIIDGFYELASNRGAVIGCVCMIFIGIILGSIRFWNIFLSLGSETTIVVSSLYYSIYTSSSLVSILPGNIGIAEAIIGLTNSILGSEFDIGVTVVLVNRIYYYIVSIFGALIAAVPVYYTFYKRDKESPQA